MYLLRKAISTGAADVGGSVESGLVRTDVDSDEELEAIRGSVRSLRAQRVAVEQLKEKARGDERTAEVLRVKLGEAESRIKDLEAHGGKDIVRRLIDEVGNIVSHKNARNTTVPSSASNEPHYSQFYQE